MVFEGSQYPPAPSQSPGNVLVQGPKDSGIDGFPQALVSLEVFWPPRGGEGGVEFQGLQGSSS